MKDIYVSSVNVYPLHASSIDWVYEKFYHTLHITDSQDVPFQYGMIILMYNQTFSHNIHIHLSFLFQPIQHHHQQNDFYNEIYFTLFILHMFVQMLLQFSLDLNFLSQCLIEKFLFLFFPW